MWGFCGMNVITYNTSTLKMVEKIDGSTTTRTFKTLESMLEDKAALEEYNLEFPSNIKVVLI
jgi:hypothetical protein